LALFLGIVFTATSVWAGSEQLGGNSKIFSDLSISTNKSLPTLKKPEAVTNNSLVMCKTSTTSELGSSENPHTNPTNTTTTYSCGISGGDSIGE